MVQHLGCKAALACLCGARLLMQYHVETAAAVESSLVLIPLLGEMDDPTTDDTNSSNISIPAEFVDCEPEETPQTEFVIVLGLFCVAITFTLSYFAERRHMDWLPEASIGVLVGAFASAIVALTRPDFSIVKHMQFSESFFFQFLLPPIIFEAGYNMKRQVRTFGGARGLCTTPLACSVTQPDWHLTLPRTHPHPLPPYGRHSSRILAVSCCMPL